MKKRIIPIILCVLLLIGIISGLTPTSSAATNGVEARIESILATFPSGSYFTVNGQGCGHSSGSTCDNCKLSNVLRSCGIPFDSSIYLDGWTCYGFASYCFGAIFNQRFDKAVGVISSGEVSSNDGMYTAFQHARTGDFVYCFKGGSVTHYAIFISCDSNGVTLLHNNIGGGGYVGKISYGYVPYSSLRGSGYGYNRVDIYRATNYDDVVGPTHYNPQGVTDMIAGGAETVTVTGWAFDRDDLSQSLEIHVYVGDEGHGGIIANAYRPDVNDAYSGVGNNHGFSATIPTNKRGEQTVYVYAINIGGGVNVELGHSTVTIREDTAEYYVDLNGLIDGAEVRDIVGYGTADLYINDSLVADDVSDFYSGNGTWRSGTNYEFKDIQPMPGYSYDGVASGSRKGTINHAGIDVRLAFSTIDPSIITENPVDAIYNGHYYRYYPSSKVTWYAAKEICESLGGHLITISSEGENQFATDLISGNGNVWIGATDARDQGNWKWVTGEAFSYTPWYAGEPNNAPAVTDGTDTEDYASLMDGYGTWNDCAGTRKLGFICELDGFPPVIANARITNVSSSGFDVTCNVKADLNLNGVQFATWTAANGQDDIPMNWEKRNDCAGTITGNTVTYHVDAADHNNEQGIYYVHVYAFDEANLATCYTLFVCIGDPLDYGITLLNQTDYNGHTYILYTGIDGATMSWTDAASLCQSLGGTLACITSEEENEIVKQLISGYATDVWIGANDIWEENTFVWESGEAFSYNAWGPTQPDSSGDLSVNNGEEDYVEMRQDGSWNDIGDGYNMWFVLELVNCTHNYEYTVFSAPTVENSGLLLGTCALCGNTVEIALPALNTTDYTYSVVTAATCTATGTGKYTWKTLTYGTFFFDVTIAKTNHSYVDTVTAPTCTEQGYTTHVCSSCSDTYVDTYVNALGHDYELTDWNWTGYTVAKATFTCKNDSSHVQTVDATITHVRTEPTCEAAGKVVYTAKVTFEGKDYTDTKEQTLDALDHNWNNPTYIWAADNNTVTATRTCKNDANHIETETANTTSEVTTPATCTAKGKTTYTVTFTNSAFAMQTKTVENVPALGHNWNAPTYAWAADNSTVTATRTCKQDSSHVETETVNTTSAVTTPATCTAKGATTYTATFTNSAFATQTKTVENVPALGHTPAAAVKENEIAATCTEAGGYDMVTTCAVCGTELKREHTDVPALGHDWGEWCPVPMNFCTDPRIEDRTCNRCGATESRTLPPDGHTPGEPVKENAIAPTCEAAGGYDMVVYCSACGAEISREHTDTPALGHNWNEPEYVWADDYGIVTATRTCKNDASHVETETVSTTSEVTKEATYDEEGEIAYTANFENEAFATQTKAVATPKLEKPDDPTPGLPCDGGDNCPGNVFTDMPTKGNWAHDAIDWAIVNKITAGTSATTFSPNAGCTRAQVVTFLWRAAGEPKPETTSNPFEDVKEGTWYYKAVLWAAETGVTAGTSATTFSPDATCTRAQIVTFLWRFEGEPAFTRTNNPFTDVKPGSYYEKAVLWASETGVTAGTSATTFSPDTTCTRAQVVTFLYRDIKD